MSSYRRQDVFPNDHPAYAGHLEINRVQFQQAALALADLIVAAGCRLDGITAADYTLLKDGQELVMLYPDRAAVAVHGPAEVLEAPVGDSLAALAARLGAPPPARLGWRDELHRAYLRHSDTGFGPTRGAVDLAAVVGTVSAKVGPEAVILTDGGSFARWIHRYYRFTRPHTQAGPVSGAMGYAVPGAVGACLARPGVPVIAFVGDGGFMMTGQELVTAVEQQLNIKIIVCDNSAHGSILLGQSRRFGDASVFATRLASPDFAAVAEAYGAPAWRVETTGAFEAALAGAMAEEGPALLHLLTDERDIVPFGSGGEAV